MSRSPSGACTISALVSGHPVCLDRDDLADCLIRLGRPAIRNRFGQEAKGHEDVPAKLKVQSDGIPLPAARVNRD